MKRIVLLGVCAFLLALIAVLPARWAAGLLPPDVQCANWRGSIWRGQCLTLTIAQQPRPAIIDTLQWKVRPASLLRLTLAAEVTLTWAKGDANGELELRRGGLLTLRDVSARALLDRELLGALPRGWRGRLDASGVQLGLQDRTVRLLAGEMLLQDLTDASGVALGSYRLAFPASAQAPFPGQLQDMGGPFEVQASIRIAADRSWELDGTVAARSAEAHMFDRQLELLGPADAAGRRHLSAAGSFN
jgi:hypothetical protein